MWKSICRSNFRVCVRRVCMSDPSGQAQANSPKKSSTCTRTTKGSSRRQICDGCGVCSKSAKPKESGAGGRSQDKKMSDAPQEDKSPPGAAAPAQKRPLEKKLTKEVTTRTLPPDWAEQGGLTSLHQGAAAAAAGGEEAKLICHPESSPCPQQKEDMVCHAEAEQCPAAPQQEEPPAAPAPNLAYAEKEPEPEPEPPKKEESKKEEPPKRVSKVTMSKPPLEESPGCQQIPNLHIHVCGDLNCSENCIGLTVCGGKMGVLNEQKVVTSNISQAKTRRSNFFYYVGQEEPKKPQPQPQPEPKQQEEEPCHTHLDQQERFVAKLIETKVVQETVLGGAVEQTCCEQQCDRPIA